MQLLTLKRFSTILLLAIIALHTFSSFVIKAEYLLNIDYITSVLCVNKEKPKLKCNGKCYLAKKLSEDQNHDQQSPANTKEKFDIQLFYLPNPFKLANVHSEEKSEYYDHDEHFYSAFLHPIFHPPIL